MTMLKCQKKFVAPILVILLMLNGCGGSGGMPVSRPIQKPAQVGTKPAQSPKPVKKKVAVNMAAIQPPTQVPDAFMTTLTSKVVRKSTNVFIPQPAVIQISASPTNAVIQTADRVTGPWTYWTNAGVYVLTNPPLHKFYRAAILSQPISFYWTPPADEYQITGYKLYRSPDGVKWSDVYSVGLGSNCTLTITNFEVTNYFAMVSVSNLMFGTKMSDPVVAVIRPAVIELIRLK